MAWRSNSKIQNAVSALGSNKSFILYGISFLYLLLILIRYRAYEMSDFLIFWNSSKFLADGISIYTPIYPDMPYLNGSLLTLLLLPTTILPYRIAFDVWFAFNVLLIWYAVKSILRYLKIDLDTTQISIAFSLIVFSYPIRHNLAIGSVVLLILALSLVAISFMNYKVSKWQSWFGAFALVFAFELKPYLVLFLILYLLLSQNIRFLLQAFVIVVGLNSIYLVVLNDSNWFSWVRAMTKRSVGLADDQTQSSLYILLRNILSIPDWISFTAYIGSIAIILILSWKLKNSAPEEYKIVLAVILGPLISLYSHPQDFVMIIPFAIVLLIAFKIHKENFPLILLLFSLFLNLSGSSRVLTFAVIICLLIIISLSNLGLSKVHLAVILLASLLTQNFAKYLLDNFNKGAQHEFLNLLCLISGYLCFWLILTKIRKNSGAF